MAEFFTGVVSADVGSWCLAVDVLHPVSVDERRRLRVERRVGEATTRRRSVDENVLRRSLRVLAANIWYWSVLFPSHQQCLLSCTAALLCPILLISISLIEWANPQLGFNPRSSSLRSIVRPRKQSWNWSAYFVLGCRAQMYVLLKASCDWM